MAEANQQEIDEHLRRLNMAWQLYDALSGEHPALAQQADPIADRFEQECRWLAEHGFPYMSLCYDPVSKEHRLPVD